ncbi:MAG: type I toxin-antitoxin system SymE family toxin [Flavobacteriaceae bacterium]|nr:type I toxin-antitoxin system SymE family toxin [Flavobacteriaceae bacterium]
MQKKQRILKTQTIIYPSKWKSPNYYPKLLLKGKWLSKVGFKRNSYVKVTIREKLIIIEPLKD